MDKIDSFRGDYRWLSNFAEVEIVYDGVKYFNTEAAYQAQKTDNDTVRLVFSSLSPKLAKALGREVTLRKDWDSELSLKVMYEVNKLKFEQEPFKTKLISTVDAELIEGNDWYDKFWGVCNGEGENHLGKILMKIRSELRG